MLATLIDIVRRRVATYRAYRRAIIEIQSMSRQELAELRLYGSDLQDAARRQILHR